MLNSCSIFRVVFTVSWYTMGWGFMQTPSAGWQLRSGCHLPDQVVTTLLLNSSVSVDGFSMTIRWRSGGHVSLTSNSSFGQFIYFIFLSIWHGVFLVCRYKCDTHLIPPKLCSNSRSRIWVEWGGIAGVNRRGKNWDPNTSYRLRRLYHLEMSVLRRHAACKKGKSYSCLLVAHGNSCFHKFTYFLYKRSKKKKANKNKQNYIFLWFSPHSGSPFSLSLHLLMSAWLSGWNPASYWPVHQPRQDWRREVNRSNGILF